MVGTAERMPCETLTSGPPLPTLRAPQTRFPRILIPAARPKCRPGLFSWLNASFFVYKPGRD
jgi:hypothetical protein